MEYAAGTLDAERSLLVACHLAFCSDCAAHVQHFESMGGALLEHAKGVAVSGLCLAKTLKKIDALSAKQHSMGDIDAVYPKPLHPYLNRVSENGELLWNHLGSRFRQIRLTHSKEGSVVRLMAVKGGQQMPAHTHMGEEYTLVLQGSLTDQYGTYHTGDVMFADSGVIHQPFVNEGEECICLVVTSAPIAFTGRFSRLLNIFSWQ
jgi:putative transcriptional regulator